MLTVYPLTVHSSQSLSAPNEQPYGCLIVSVSQEPTVHVPVCIPRSLTSFVLGDDEGFLSVAHREAPAVRRGGGAALVRRAKAEGGGDVEGGVAFELVALWLDAKPDKVRDVASVDVGVSLPGGLLASGGAVAAVTEAQHARWLVGDAQRGEGGEGGSKHGGVAVGMVSGVDGGIAEAVMLGDMVASCSGGVEGGGERADVEANPALGLRNEDLGGDDGAPHAHVGKTAKPVARTRVCPGSPRCLFTGEFWLPRDAQSYAAVNST